MMELAMSWALDRLNEKATWLGIMAALGGKLGVHFNPEFDTVVVNGALALVAIVSYVVKGGPTIIKK